MTITEYPGESPRPPIGLDYDAHGFDEKGNLYHQRYGRWFAASEKWDELFVELWAFRHGRTVEQGGLGKYQHAINCINLLWNSGEQGETLELTPWFLKMLQEACIHQYLGIVGCASSGKSHFAAIWGLLNWICAPEETLILVTSTSLNAARQRVWGSVLSAWGNLPKRIQDFGKLIDSIGAIRFVRPDGTKAPDNIGVVLIASEPKKDANSVGKIIGRKAPRLFLLADELPELSEAVCTASYSNLIHNPFHQMIALGNPSTFFDPLGTFCEPKDGWDSITEFDEEWDTKRGKVISFDILKSENYVQKKRVRSYMASYETIEKSRADLGENSIAFIRMFRGKWPPAGADNSLYNSFDLLRLTLKQDEFVWKKGEDPVKVAGLDISYGSGGDRNVLIRGLLGRIEEDSRKILKIEEIHILKQDAIKKNHNHGEHICEQIQKIVAAHGISHSNVAYDSTAGGSLFGNILVRYLSNDVLGVNFGGKASDLPISASNRNPSHTKYSNRSSELWAAGLEFLRGQQLACLPQELMAELSQRGYTSGNRGMITIECKADVKKKVGRSPDISDAFAILLALCRERHHFRSVERGLAILPKREFIQQMKRFDVVTLSNPRAEWEPMSA